MFKGLILKEDNTIARVLENILEINESKKHILFGRNSKLGSIDFTTLNIVVTDDPREFKVGDTIPIDVVDKKESLIVKSERELIEQLQKENADLMLQLVMKGVL